MASESQWKSKESWAEEFSGGKECHKGCDLETESPEGHSCNWVYLCWTPINPIVNPNPIYSHLTRDNMFKVLQHARLYTTVAKQRS
jgi:hypothetical protein